MCFSFMSTLCVLCFFPPLFGNSEYVVLVLMCAMYILVAFAFSPSLELSITPLEC